MNDKSKLSYDMRDAVTNIELLGLYAENYIIYHNYEALRDNHKMVNICDMGRYQVLVKRNKLLMKDSFVVIPKNTCIKIMCDCCGQSTTTND